MAVANAFSKVKEAIPPHADALLAEYGVKHHREGTLLKGDFTTGFLCPLCGDKSGSASFTHQLYLKCHQCATKADVFDWLSKHTGQKAWDLCKTLAKRLNVDLPAGKRPAKGQRSMPLRMTEDILEQAIVDLWEHKEAEQARAILADRQLDDQQALAELEVGWIRGWIVFPSRDERGVLQERFRAWNPTNTKTKWMWFGVGTGGPGIWPCRPAPDGSRTLLLEGESDVMTAIVRLRLHEQGWHVVTWTAGATSCPAPKDVPRSMHGKETFVGYDNDVFQGSDYQGYYVETKPGKDPAHARLAMEQRLRNLLQKVGPLFVSLGCKVTVLQCPVDPREKYGGDFRDWVNNGGRELFKDWKAFPLDELPEYGKLILDLPFAEVFGTPHKLVRTRVQVEAIARDDVTLANIFEMKCEMGQHPACASCPGARLFADGIIDMTDYQRELAVGLEQQNVSKKIIEDVIQKPRGCPRVEVVPMDISNGSEWKGCQPGKVEDATQRSLHVFSADPPSLSGEMEVEGICYPNARGNGLVMLATSVRQLDKAEVDIAPVMQELLTECPSFTDKVEDIDAFFDRRSRDLGFHVTRIYGRRDIHIAHDLLMHSVKRAVLWGANQRAWLDICVFGDTRSGKSLTFRRLFDYHGLGIHHTAVSNISRAGLLMGADKNGMLKPGLLPRCNGKALMLDEFHFLVQNTLEHPMSWMQSARDDGVASGVKIYGNRDLPAAVRLVTIANWMRNKRRVFEFDCEHLGALYGAPETLARLDFGLVINNKPEQGHLDKVDQFWTKERTRSLILRAWAMESDQVLIDDAAFERAKRHCKDWEELYDSEQLPLFTAEEKCYSLMRIAIAVANATFSHPRHDPYSVHVRPVHVDWAANWLVHLWKSSGYDLYSEKRRNAQKVVKIFEAERMFTFALGLEDSQIAISMLGMFLTPFGPSEIVTLTAQEIQVAHNWLARMVALHVFERTKLVNSHNVQYQLTDGGRELVGNLIRLAEHDEVQWRERYRAIVAWSAASIGPGRSDPDLVPMNAESWEIFDTPPAAGEVPF
jgi:hypothetical protein